MTDCYSYGRFTNTPGQLNRRTDGQLNHGVSSTKLRVVFCAELQGEGPGGGGLAAYTVDQVSTRSWRSRAKFGFPLRPRGRGHASELEQGEGVFVALKDVDGGSEVVGSTTRLNTLQHYKMDPDECVDQTNNPERKKLKLKELHLNKLLGIWGSAAGSKAPPPIKHFFDFLDAQAAAMKISDPDVLHIWKTNSLPLRFWVNILKNPQFVFDVEKSPHVDGCLSVVAQAFMDSFSLSDTQLGKHAPTNKLLYAKDVPQFKQEVRAYYKSIREQQPIAAAEFADFLLQESKKHESEFNEAAAIRELYKFIHQYFTPIERKLERDGAPDGLKERLRDVKNIFDGEKNGCSWD
ncbi:hypothetical protein CRUP_035816 [Coryphaenoides rupestris]|nr:hypothetical protein CRUP_035816 [Coryphaenoides rupestris]